MKTLVCLVSQQTIPNYLFIKDHIEPGDRLLFFYTTQSKPHLEYILNTLQLDNEVDMQEINPENWTEMLEQISSNVVENQSYLVNFTCGTSYMSMALRQVFEAMPNVEFFYTPYPRNIYLQLDKPNKDIEHRLSINEYLSLYNVKKQKEGTSELVRSEEYTTQIFKLFVEDKIDKNILNLLRTKAYRDRGIKDIQAVERENTETKPQIEGLQEFLNAINFANRENQLTKYEVRYLTGGWFEEYLFSLIKNQLRPDDITMGLHIGDARNDLDVVFTLGNKLYVCECKTGIVNFNPNNVSAMFSEIVYKLTALKDSLGNLSANTYVCALTDPHEKATKVAQYFKQTYCSREIFTNPEKTEEWISKLRKSANI